MCQTKTVYKTNSRIPALGILKNLMRPLTVWFEDDYCSITVASHRLTTVIQFIAKSYTYPWRAFVNILHLELHAEPRKHILGTLEYKPNQGHSFLAYPATLLPPSLGIYPNGSGRPPLPVGREPLLHPLDREPMLHPRTLICAPWIKGVFVNATRKQHIIQD